MEPGDAAGVIRTRNGRPPSTEPGLWSPGDPGRRDRRYQALRPSTEPGLWSPGDHRRHRGGLGLRRPSEEPCLWSPGAPADDAINCHFDFILQRSRGYRAPVTSRIPVARERDVVPSTE